MVEAQSPTLDTAPPSEQTPPPAAQPSTATISQDCKNAATGTCSDAAGAPSNLNTCVNNAIDGNFDGGSMCCDAFSFILTCEAVEDVCTPAFFAAAQGWGTKANCPTPSPSPTPSATLSPSPSVATGNISSQVPNNSSSAACFPKGSLVTLPSGKQAPIETVNVGDRVLVEDGVYSEIFFFSHRDPNQISDFVSIQTQGTSSMGTLTVSPSHLIFVSGTLKAAKLARVGDSLVSSSGVPLKIVSIKAVRLEGLYNPHTLAGDVVVNGIRASCFTEAVEPKMAHALLRPLELAYRLGLRLPGFLDKTPPSAMLGLVSS